MKQNIVTIVAHKETGEVLSFREITDKATGDIRTVGTLMVQSKALGNLSGIGGLRTRTAFITLEQPAIDFLGTLKDGQVFPVAGKIQVVETLEPYTTKSGKVQESKINPSTGDEILSGGQPVYRNQIFTENINATDVLLETDKETVDVEVDTPVDTNEGEE